MLYCEWGGEEVQVQVESGGLFNQPTISLGPLIITAINGLAEQLIKGGHF